MTDQKLEQRRQLEQSIHNLKVLFPTGIKSIDDANDERLKQLEKILIEVYG